MIQVKEGGAGHGFLAWHSLASVSYKDYIYLLHAIQILQEGNQSTTKGPQETPKVESTIAPLTANKNVFTRCTIMATRITNATFHYFNPKKCLTKNKKNPWQAMQTSSTSKIVYCRCMFRPGNPTAFSLLKYNHLSYRCL